MTDKTKARIQELVPEIKGGHRFRIGEHFCQYCNDPRYVIERIVGNMESVLMGAQVLREVSERRIDQLDFPCSRNPYRPITLEDVLKAMDATDSTSVCGWGVAINGMFFKNATPAVQWTLGKTWDDQPEETKLFIGKILNVE